MLLCLSVAVTGVSGNLANEIIAKAADTTPTIDGVISPGEWISASNVTFNQTTVYVMQDGTNLYVAFNVSDSTYSGLGDECHIFFDVKNDKSSSLQSDDRYLVVKRNNNLVELKENAGGWQLTTTSGWTAAVNSLSTLWQVEYSITYAKINVTAGSAKIIGVEFESFDVNIPPMGARYMWPYSEDPNFDTKPNLWGNLISINWVPEFSNPLILFIAFTATISILLYVKVRKNQKLYK